MNLVEGWWSPKITSSVVPYLRRAQALHVQVVHATRTRAVVQAGGHIGIYPKILSTYFDRVYTFEPENENFCCLVRNCDSPAIYPFRAILGEAHEGRELRLGKGTGGHNVGGAGPVPTFTIDDLALTDCDAIVLDIEGFEIHALRGAMKTIKRTHPLIIVEENKKMHNKGFQFGDAERLLAPYHYKVVARMGEDLVLK